MNRNIGKIIAVAILVLGFGGLIIWKLASRVNYNNYNLYDVIPASADTGNLEEHIKGDPDSPIKLIEYADYQCDYCALYNPRVNKLLEEYEGKVAIVYRNFLLDYHQNGTAAASAAEAAALQGYWADYADYLFTNQSSWAYASTTERLSVFTSFFETVSEGKGDLEKFKTDLRSDAVAKKISFDMGAGKFQGVDGTPSFYLNGEHLKLTGVSDEDAFLSFFREKLDAALEEYEKNKSGNSDNSNNSDNPDSNNSDDSNSNSDNSNSSSEKSDSNN